MGGKDGRLKSGVLVLVVLVLVVLVVDCVEKVGIGVTKNRRLFVHSNLSTVSRAGAAVVVAVVVVVAAVVVVVVALPAATVGVEDKSAGDVGVATVEGP